MAAREAGCYKVILDCAEENAAFYEKCGLTIKEIQMVRLFFFVIFSGGLMHVGCGHL